jgi:putative nucleotidyltransferase with HDIG domain
MKIIKDPVHGYVEADATALRLLDSEVVQRLRHVSQLGFANLVYPGANHTRFEHSLGTMHLAALMCRELGLDDGETKLVTTAALLHDIGHGPFSHVTEPVMEEFTGRSHHQIDRLVGEGTIAAVLEAEGIDPAEVCAAVSGEHRLASIIHGSLDVDRMDYLMRDAHYTGVPYGTVDAHRLIRSTILTDSGVALHEGGINAAESLLIARTLMRPAVYFHHVSRIATSMFVHALREEVLNVPGADAEEFARMDDAACMERLKHSPHPITRDLARRVYYRDLYKRALYVGEDRVNAAAFRQEPGAAREREIARHRRDRRYRGRGGPGRHSPAPAGPLDGGPGPAQPHDAGSRGGLAPHQHLERHPAAAVAARRLHDRGAPQHRGAGRDRGPPGEAADKAG